LVKLSRRHVGPVRVIYGFSEIRDACSDYSEWLLIDAAVQVVTPW
jgi:hypothetical protein